jgi:hypothetical protein
MKHLVLADKETWRALVLRATLNVYGDSKSSTGVIAWVMNPCASAEELHWMKFAPLN